jgi:hypothetical protein
MSKKSRKSELLDGFCHSERSRGISSYLTLQMIRDVSTTFDMTRTADGSIGSAENMTNDESRRQLLSSFGFRHCFVLRPSTPVRLGPFVVF